MKKITHNPSILNVKAGYPVLQLTDIYLDKLTESLIQLLIDFGVRNIVMAEATFGSARMTDVFFSKTGFLDLARRYSIDLNTSQPVDVRVKDPLVMDTLSIAKEVFEADKIINIPNMKVHYATGITLALKNLKGLLVGDEKKRFHETGLEKVITDLNNTIQPHLTIVDAISCMERMGPRGGDIVELNLIMAGAHPVEVNTIGSRIMGYGIDEVKHLGYSIESRGIDINAIEVVGESIEDTSYPFALRDIRIYPLVDLKGSESRHIKPVLSLLKDLNRDVSLQKVPYEFQKGATHMMRIGIPHS